MTTDKIKVLIIDDSVVVRQLLSKGLELFDDIEVIGKAADVYIARDLIVRLKPDVITLDVEMPRMNGVEFLKRLMPQYPLPVIMVSSLTEKNSDITLSALEHGALDFVLKPSATQKKGFENMLKELVKKIRAVAFKDLSFWKDNSFKIEKVKRLSIPNRKIEKIIAIGASTGGTIATKKILTKMPANSPGIIVVQHMPEGFTNRYARSLNDLLELDVKEAEDGDRVDMGRVYVAPGNYHIKLVKRKGMYYIEKFSDDKVNGHRPSVDVFFNSAASAAGHNSIGVLLTGMGKDGAKGLLKMKESGAHTLAQDEKTSIVFGMPGEAKKIGAVESMVDINKMADKIVELIKKDEEHIRRKSYLK